MRINPGLLQNTGKKQQNAAGNKKKKNGKCGTCGRSLTLHILAFLDFLVFLGFPTFLSFVVRFHLFSREFRGFAKRNPCSFGGLSLLLPKMQMQGLEA